MTVEAVLVEDSRRIFGDLFGGCQAGCAEQEREHKESRTRIACLQIVFSRPGRANAATAGASDAIVTLANYNAFSSVLSAFAKLRLR